MSGLYKMITALMFIGAVFSWGMGKFPQHRDGPAPVLTAQAERHILYGNGHGGGHLHGRNKACKSEFPASWNADKIIRTIKAEAANDNNNWKKAGNGYQTTERNVDGVRIRIVLNGKTNEIVTAYPVNALRNACFNERRRKARHK